MCRRSRRSWITPGGQLLGAGTEDVLVVASKHAPPAGRRLGDLLVPALDRDDPSTASLDDQAVEQIQELVQPNAS